MRASISRRLPCRLALCALSVCTVLSPLAFAASSTRLKPIARQDRAASSEATQSDVIAADILDSVRTGILLDLYKQLVAGAPFSEEEAIILNRFAGDRDVSQLEADIVISRALYVRFVEHAVLTKEQETLLASYAELVARRTNDIADRKTELARREAAKGDDGGRLPAVPPANDMCAGAQVIPGAGPFPALTTTVDVTDATATGDPVAAPSCAFAGGPVSRSVWYTFNPAATSSYTLSLCADAPTATTLDDTVMAVYTSTGGCAGPFTQVPAACDEDSCSVEGLQSVLTTSLTSGTQYYIVVWKYGTTAPLPGDSAVQLRVTQNNTPANDTCAGAVALTLNIPAVGLINNLTANDYQVAAAPNCFTGTGNTATTAPGRDVVYSFTPASSGNFSFRVTNYAQTSLVLYVTAGPCPTGAPPITVTTTLPVGPPAPCSNRNVTPAEEVFCQALTSGTTYFVFVDETTATSGGNFLIEVNPCSIEVEANGTPATANPAVCNIEGAITAANELDFFSVGTFGVGARLFAMVDGVAANTTDFDLRATTTTDTLEYDDADNDTPFGVLSPNIAGAKLQDMTASFLAVRQSANAQTGPYRVLYAVQPGGAGFDGTSATPETEPNNTVAAANAAGNFYYSGALSSSSDTDVYRFVAAAGDLVFISADFDPTLVAGTPSSSSPVNGALALLNSSGTSLISVNDGDAVSNTTTGAASLTATTPSKPAEAIAFRVVNAGAYYVRVTGAAAGDYLLSVSVNCTTGSNCVVTCPANVTVSNDPNQCGAVVNYPAPTTTGSCGTVTCVPASGSFFPVGTTTVNCAAQSGSACSFTVTVNDTQPPSISCPANVTQANDPNQCGAVVSYAAPTATDNCPGVTTVCAPASGSFFPKGATMVSCTATDAAMNTATCSFSVTINDTQAPAITCPANITTGASTTQDMTPGAIVTYVAPVVSDNCPGVGAPSCVPASGSFFPVGTTTVTCSVTDASANSASCTFTVTVGTPFTICCVDDGTGNTLSIVTDPANPLYGLWRLRVASSGAVLLGTAEFLSYVPGRSLTAYDHDNPAFRMDMNINYASATCTATVKVLATGATYTIRDRNITNNPPCS